MPVQTCAQVSTLLHIPVGQIQVQRRKRIDTGAALPLFASRRSLLQHLQILLCILVARQLLAARHTCISIALACRTDPKACETACKPVNGLSVLYLASSDLADAQSQQLYAITCSKCSTQFEKYSLNTVWLNSAVAEKSSADMLLQAGSAPSLFEVHTRIPRCYCTRCRVQQSAVQLTLPLLLLLRLKPPIAQRA